MPKIREGEATVIELLKKLLIIELYKLGMGQNEIARNVGMHVSKVGVLLKNLKIKKGSENDR